MALPASPAGDQLLMKGERKQWPGQGDTWCFPPHAVASYRRAAPRPAKAEGGDSLLFLKESDTVPGVGRGPASLLTTVQPSSPSLVD